MTRKIAALSGAWLCLSVVYFIGLTFFGHLYAAEARGSQPLVPGLVGFAISNALLVLFFSWLADQLGHAFKAGLAVAIPQMLLVNVNYVLSGARTVTAGVLSTVVLFVAWPLVAVVYQTILGCRPSRERP